MKLEWNRLDARAWQAASPETACALQQSWRYGAAIAAMGRRVERAGILVDGRLQGLAQVILRRAGPVRVGYLPRGPILWSGAEARIDDALIVLSRGLPGMGPLIAAPGPSPRALVPLVSPTHMAVLPLSPDPDVMRARMRGKWRNRLSRARTARLKVAVTAPGEAELRALVARDRAQGAERGYRSLPLAFLSAWKSAGGAPMRLYTARARGDVIAAMLFLDHPPGATYHIGWSGSEGRRVNAHSLLLWRAMCDFARDGRRQVELGPLDTVRAPGVARFKMGAGAVAQNLGATGLVIPGGLFSPWRGRALRRRLAEPAAGLDR